MTKTLTRDEWLAEKRNSVSASEAAKVIERNRVPLSMYGDGYEVYCSKVFGYDTPENDAMMRGTKEEPHIAWKYGQLTKREVIDDGDTYISRSSDYPFITATLDRRIKDNQQHRAPNGCSGYGALELKDTDPEWYPLWVACERQYKWDPISRQRRLCLIPHRKPYEEWILNPPMEYQCQLQIQMYCADLQWGSLCGKFQGDKVVWRDYKRNDRFLAWAIPQLVKFWGRVERLDPPPIRLERSLKVVEACFPEDDGSTTSLNENTTSKVFEWEKIKQEMSELDSKRKILRAQIVSEMENSTWADLPDRRYLKYKMTKRGYRQLSIVKYKK